MYAAGIHRKHCDVVKQFLFNEVKGVGARCRAKQTWTEDCWIHL